MGDVLSGQRNAVNDGATTLYWPDGAQPVKAGQVFKLRSCHIEITKVHRVHKEGTLIWRAEFMRHLPDVPRIPAQQAGLSHPPQYVPTNHGSVDGIGEEVDRDWQRRFAEEARMKTVAQGAAHRQRTQVIREETRLRAEFRPQATSAIERRLKRWAAVTSDGGA